MMNFIYLEFVYLTMQTIENSGQNLINRMNISEFKQLTHKKQHQFNCIHNFSKFDYLISLSAGNFKDQEI